MTFYRYFPDKTPPQQSLECPRDLWAQSSQSRQDDTIMGVRKIAREFFYQFNQFGDLPFGKECNLKSHWLSAYC
jgi:hypothetical protein